MKTEILKFNNQSIVSTHHVKVTSKSLLWTKSHIHDEVEILYVLDKTLTCKTSDGKEFVVSKGEVIIFNQNVLHETISVVGTEYYALQIPYLSFLARIGISFPYVKTDSQLLSYIYFDKEDQKSLVLKNYIENLFSSEEDSELFVHGYISLIMAFLQKMKLLPSIDNSSSEIIQKLLPALQYLNSHFKEKITINDVAKQTNFNLNYFERLFKKAFDMTVTDYVNTLRINESKKLLCTTQKSIEEIAGICGFSTTPYMNKVFKKYTQLTPAAYRKFKQKAHHPDTYQVFLEYEPLLQIHKPKNSLKD